MSVDKTWRKREIFFDREIKLGNSLRYSSHQIYIYIYENKTCVTDNEITLRCILSVTIVPFFEIFCFLEVLEIFSIFREVKKFKAFKI